MGTDLSLRIIKKNLLMRTLPDKTLHYLMNHLWALLLMRVRISNRLTSFCWTLISLISLSMEKDSGSKRQRNNHQRSHHLKKMIRRDGRIKSRLRCFKLNITWTRTGLEHTCLSWQRRLVLSLPKFTNGIGIKRKKTWKKANLKKCSILMKYSKWLTSMESKLVSQYQLTFLWLKPDYSNLSPCVFIQNNL